MKKTYVKPEVYFESFELSASIAAGCSAGFNHGNTNFGNAHSCYFEYGTDRVYLSTTQGCTLTDNVSDDEICYHVPFSQSKIFSS